jgi:hypothetical protein
MELKDLKTGMVVELRNGDKYLVINQAGKLSGIRENSYITFNSLYAHKSDMTWSDDSCLDIVKVFCPSLSGFRTMLKNERNCIWTRDEKRKMTVSEICKELGYEVEIVKE